jgi:predicted RNase H-like HicB family nuclease
MSSPKLETLGDRMTFTAVYMPVPEGYIGFVEEIPGANSQGETLDEVRENLREAVQLVLEANREMAEQALVGRDVEREPFELAS